MNESPRTFELVADDVSDADSYEAIRDDGVEVHHDVEIRRNAMLSGVLGAAAAVLALAWLVRLVSHGGISTLAFTFVLALIAVAQGWSFLDARVPLLVADSFGVRIRLGKEWRGLPWSSLEQVVVEQSTSVLHDGRLVVAPRSLARALEGLDERGRRQVAVSQKLYRAPLVVPLGMTTRVSAPHLVDALAQLAGGRAAVIELASHVDDPVLPLEEDHMERLEARQREAEEQSRPTHPPLGGDRAAGSPQLVGAGAVSGRPIDGGEPTAPHTFSGLSIFDKLGFDQWAQLKTGAVATLISRTAQGRSHDVDAPPAPAVPALPAAPAGPSWSPAVPLRSARPASRVDVRMEVDTTPVVLGAVAHKLDPAETDDTSPRLPEVDILHHHSDDLAGWHDADDALDPTAYDVRPIAVPGDPVPAVVIDDFEPDGAGVPVIGPEIAAARTRLGLDIDTLSDRTRIRPHVLEAIEVDDFGPCGGDFYARGHLRALGRVLGLEPETLVEQFDERYASAPIQASRVFEAELATGSRGSIRATFGGPRWGLMLAVVLVLILVWGAARLFAADAPQAAAPPSLNGSAGVVDQQPITSVFGAPVRISVRAERGASDVVVRDHSGQVLWTGQLAQGSHRQIVGVGPFTVRASDPSVVDVWLAGKPQGAIGATTTPGTRTFKQ